MKDTKGPDFPPAKVGRTPSSENYFIHFLCGLCVFAGDIPSFGYGSAGLSPSWQMPLNLEEAFF